MVLDVGGGRPDDACQRGAQIVGDRAQEVRPDPFVFRFMQLSFPFGDHLILTGQFGGHGADRYGEDQHTYKSDRIAAHSKIYLKERVSEKSVNEDDAEQGGNNAVQVSGCPSCNQDEGKDIDQRDIGGVVLHKMKEKESKPGCKRQHYKCI